MFWFCQLYVAERKRALHGIIFVAMGIVLEVLQGMGGLRQYDALDMVANAAGVATGWAVARLLPPLLPRS
jgi:hypothetical protein